MLQSIEKDLEETELEYIVIKVRIYEHRFLLMIIYDRKDSLNHMKWIHF